MVSRRKILNRSRDDLNVEQEVEDDIWFSKEKLFKVSLQFLSRLSALFDNKWHLMLTANFGASSDQLRRRMKRRKERNNLILRS